MSVSRSELREKIMTILYQVEMYKKSKYNYNLDDVIRAASRLTMPRGKFFMIHRPIRLVDILTIGRKYNMEPKQIQFIHPRSGKAPNLVLVEFMKDGKPELKILDPLYVYGEDGNYTEELKAIYANEDIGEK